MNFNCEKTVLLNGIVTASRTVAAKSTIPALEGLLIETEEDCLILTGYNLKTGIRTKVPADVREGGKIIINARLLAEIVRKMAEGSINFSVDGSFLVKISCSASYFEIMGSSADNFPELPAVDAMNSIGVPEGKLKEMISQTLFAVSTNETRPVHTGSLFEVENGELTVVSVDGFRLALRREKISDESVSENSFVVPGSALSEVEKIASDSEETVTISLGSRHIMFSIGDTEVISRRLEGEFLDYRKSIPSQGKYTVFADRKLLIDVFERVSLVINEKYKSPVRCCFGNKILKVSSATALGKANDECGVDGDGEGLEIGFNNRYMLDALRAVPSDEIKIQISSGVSPCVILPADDSDSFVYLVLPVRIKAEDA
ncbi:MAG: DNA polymerase III subunit beta [Oscillospiraceae bacterium]|jgi:DNA polymerase-3 subunit beta|nr:DNA polymerase III subunit beta [Oscillospiraceae bacterium]